jgi:Co/Zn/Cd efflux system component
VLGGFASAMFLMFVVGLMVYGSVERLFKPEPIQYLEAMAIAVLGLVIADAATSVAAIVALIGGWLLGWSWLDPVMGIVVAVIVALRAKELIKETSKVLLDREMDHPVVQEIRDVIEAQGAASETAIADLHVWRVGKGAYACLG